MNIANRDLKEKKTFIFVNTVHTVVNKIFSMKYSFQQEAVISFYNPPINFGVILLATLHHVVQIHRTVITQ